MEKSKKIMLTTVLSSIGLHLVIFLMYFIPYYVVQTNADSSGLVIYEYIRSFMTKFIEFAIPVVACTVIYFTESVQTIGRAALRCLYIALGKLIYLIPYYYLWFYEASGGSDSGEALVMSALASLFDLTIFFVYILLLFLAIRFISNRRNCKEIHSAFDFSYALCVGIFVPSFVQFLIYFIQEVITTVDYLKSYAGYYRTGEIVYMIFSFLFIFACMIATHLIAHMLAVKLDKKEEC